MDNHEIYMKRAIYLAKRAVGLTYPNPMVGCVITYNDKIIGEAWHHKAGKHHAEINAINSVFDKNLLKKSTLYVTLEPCSHYGKTPPCAEKISEIGIPKVVIGTSDPNEKVNGKGIKLLNNSGIKVITNILKNECIELNKHFFCFHKNKRPYITLKWAESADGFIDKNFKPFPISNNLSQWENHNIRSQNQAILVGTKTVLRDNPKLTVRGISAKNPIRIVLDRNLLISENFHVLNHESETIILNEKEEKSVKNLSYIELNFDKYFLENLIKKLYDKNIQSLIVEGGAFTINEFLKLNLWDEIKMFKSKNLILKNGTKAPNVTSYNNFYTKIIRNDELTTYKNTKYKI